MNSSDLTQRQLTDLCGLIRRHLHFLGRLRDRMEKLGFRPDDRLYIATTQAFNAIHALHVECHYLTCQSGVGRADAPSSQQAKKTGTGTVYSPDQSR